MSNHCHLVVDKTWPFFLKLALALGSCISFLCISSADAAETSPAGLTLRGIVRWPDRAVALLENTNRRGGQRRNYILATGERDGEAEVIEIGRESVKVLVGGGPQEGPQELQLSFSSAPSENTATATGAGSMRLEDANTELVFPVYQELSGRTVLRPARLPGVKLTLAERSVATKQDLVKVLDAALAETGVLIQPHREKFAVVGTKKADLGKLKPELWELAQKLSPDSNGASAEDLPAGVIRFPNVDLAQVLRVFQELANLTVLRPATLPAPTISLMTQTALSRAEVAYAFLAVLAVNDISVALAGDKFVVIYSVWEKDKVASLLGDIQLKTMSGADSVMPRGTLRFQNTDLRTIARIYGELLGQTVTVAPSTPGVLVQLETQTPLTKAEAVYGIEFLLGLNGLKAVADSNGSGMTIMPAAQAGR